MKQQPLGNFTMVELKRYVLVPRKPWYLQKLWLQETKVMRNYDICLRLLLKNTYILWNNAKLPRYEIIIKITN